MSSSDLRVNRKPKKNERRRSGSISKEHHYSLSDMTDKPKVKHRSNTIIEQPLDFLENISENSNLNTSNSEFKYGKNFNGYHKFFSSTSNIIVDKKSFRKQKAQRIDTKNLQYMFALSNKALSSEAIVAIVMENMEYEDLIQSMRVTKLWNTVAKRREIWLIQYQRYESILKDSKERNVNMWESGEVNDEKTNEESKTDQWTTLNDLVLRLTPYQSIPEHFETEALLNTYTSFTTTQQLIRKLWERYNVPVDEKLSPAELEVWNKSVRKPIQARTCFIIKSMIRLRYHEFTPNLRILVKIMTKLLDETLSAVIKNQIKREQATILLNNETISTPAPLIGTTSKKSFFSTLSFGYFGKKNKFLIYTCEEIAKELTLIEFSTYKDIKTPELINQSWNKSGKDQTSPNIRKMIERFNYTTRAITTSILNEEKVKTRARVFTKWIKIAKSLEKLQNYHTLMAVLMGLDDSPINRLNLTKDLIKPKHLQMFKKMNRLMSPDGSYSKYRKTLAIAKPPCIPYIGIYLRDLTYIESTPGKREKDGKQDIRFNQNLKVYGVIHFLKNYQNFPYEHQSIIELSNMLKNMQTMTETECHDMSRKLEPKKETLPKK